MVKARPRAANQLNCRFIAVVWPLALRIASSVSTGEMWALPLSILPSAPAILSAGYEDFSSSVDNEPMMISLQQGVPSSAISQTEHR